MNSLKNKMKNKKGFTLMEMLIVVAIMVVLMAVAIPMFTSQLNGAKANVDEANERSAKSAILTEYMANQNTTYKNTTGSLTLYFDAADGSLKPEKTGITPYGQTAETKTQVIKAVLNLSNYSVTTTWE